MAAKKYHPLHDQDDTLDSNQELSSPNPSHNAEESAPIVEQSFSLSDSEDENDSVFEDTQTEPLPPPFSHPLQTLPIPECIQLSTPVTESATDEEKPEAPQPRVVGLGNDGVFANLSAKPMARPEPRTNGTGSGGDQGLPAYPPSGEGDGEARPAGPLPDYDEAMQEPSPPHFDDAISHPTSLRDVSVDDLLVEGLPVGGVLSFVWNALISEMFPYIGFLLTYLLHINHAGRLGSFMGLGLTLLLDGFRLQTNITRSNSGSSANDDTSFSSEHHDASTSIWFAYMLMVLGWIIMLKSVTDYIRLRRERHAILTSPESGITQ